MSLPALFGWDDPGAAFTQISHVRVRIQAYEYQHAA